MKSIRYVTLSQSDGMGGHHKVCDVVPEIAAQVAELVTDGFGKPAYRTSYQFQVCENLDDVAMFSPIVKERLKKQQRESAPEAYAQYLKLKARFEG